MSDNHKCPFYDETISTEDAMREHLWMCGSKTEKCFQCSKYIQRMFFVYHQDNNCQNPLITDPSTPLQINDGNENHLDENVSSIPKQTNVITIFGNFLEHLNNQLGERAYSSEINHLKEKLEFNIILIGSPRVGKSQLINVLCDGKHLAETSQSLHSCTKEVKCSKKCPNLVITFVCFGIEETFSSR
ncbi:unnamed protein product [Rotaria sordida]|uniref:G domain-containing protein n=1 Tax=Rotaria sordida TaxID=392033 RepID=A0A819WRF5_9BILA|nr:unnamed protein product [Rotaria sordida]